MKRIEIILVILLTVLITSSLGQDNSSNTFSLYADIKAHQVGDVITVLVMENARASRESNIQSNSQAKVNADGTIGGSMTQFLPLFGASTTVSNSVDDREGTQQQDQLTAKLTATIVEETATGLFRIAGERSVDVNGEKNIMELEGFVRARDISSDNTVYSYHIADANIVYKQGGAMNKVTKPARFARWGTALVSMTLLSAAIVGGF